MQGLQQVDEAINSKSLGPHFDRVCAVAASDAYTLAYKRMTELQGKWADSLCAKELSSQGRLFIGLSTASLFGTSISLDSTYGVPVIRGEACKGLARRVALRNGVWSDALVDALFGSTKAGTGQGLVRFMDAWWVPNSAPVAAPLKAGDSDAPNRPLVREVVTPHHTDFQETGHWRTVFDLPKPVPMIAAHGKFRFAVAGPKVWAESAMALLQEGLRHDGIGARTPEYGRFA